MSFYGRVWIKGQRQDNGTGLGVRWTGNRSRLPHPSPPITDSVLLKLFIPSFYFKPIYAAGDSSLFPCGSAGMTGKDPLKTERGMTLPSLSSPSSLHASLNCLLFLHFSPSRVPSVGTLMTGEESVDALLLAVQTLIKQRGCLMLWS